MSEKNLNKKIKKQYKIRQTNKTLISKAHIEATSELTELFIKVTISKIKTDLDKLGTENENVNNLRFKLLNTVLLCKYLSLASRTYKEKARLK